MNPQEILNAQYTAPDMPDVSQVSEAMRTVRDHVAKNKGPYAMLAASLPIIGYGAHRMMRRTPEADPEPSTHTQQPAVEMPMIQQGSDKIAEEVLARFGLSKAAGGPHMSYGPNILGGAIRGGVIGGLGTAAVSAFRQRNEPNLDWDRVRKSALQGAGVGAVVNGGLSALGTYAHNGASDALHHMTEQLRANAPHASSDPFGGLYEEMARAHVRDVQSGLRRPPASAGRAPPSYLNSLDDLDRFMTE